MGIDTEIRMTWQHFDGSPCRDSLTEHSVPIVWRNGDGTRREVLVQVCAEGRMVREK